MGLHTRLVSLESAASVQCLIDLVELLLHTREGLQYPDPLPSGYCASLLGLAGDLCGIEALGIVAHWSSYGGLCQKLIGTAGALL